ncbi:F0F1 ATP synthase subunit delta [Candidatus Kaiserbacteria bacterium]|nr:F0F1 ATP synthase subunit delta [Candidatus Kaiserbacteria bacterium]
MESTYAKALWQMVEGGTTPKQAVAKLRDYLAGRGRINLLPRIGRALLRIAARERGKRAVVLSVAAKKDTAKAEREARQLLQELGADSGDVEIHVDDSLIGGWRLEGRECLVDASFKKSLLSIYNRATQ